LEWNGGAIASAGLFLRSLVRPLGFASSARHTVSLSLVLGGGTTAAVAGAVAKAARAGAMAGRTPLTRYIGVRTAAIGRRRSGVPRVWGRGSGASKWRLAGGEWDGVEIFVELLFSRNII